MRTTLILALVGFSSACTTTHSIERSELKKLDGFTADDRERGVSLISRENGRRVAFDGSLTLHLRGNDEPFEGHFESIHVDDDELRGRLDTGESVRFRWSSATAAETVAKDSLRTGLLVGGVVLGGSLTALLLYEVVCCLASGFGGGILIHN